MDRKYKIAVWAVLATLGSTILGGGLGWWFVGLLIGKYIARFVFTIALAIFLYILFYVIIIVGFFALLTL